MPALEQEIEVTWKLPRNVVDEITASVNGSHRSVDEEVAARLSRSIHDNVSIREAADRAYAVYRAHLEQSGLPEPTAEEILEQLRRSREEIANELYPD